LLASAGAGVGADSRSDELLLLDFTVVPSDGIGAGAASRSDELLLLDLTVVASAASPESQGWPLRVPASQAWEDNESVNNMKKKNAVKSRANILTTSRKCPGLGRPDCRFPVHHTPVS
jgi:hypothetical protein